MIKNKKKKILISIITSIILIISIFGNLKFVKADSSGKQDLNPQQFLNGPDSMSVGSLYSSMLFSQAYSGNLGDTQISFSNMKNMPNTPDSKKVTNVYGGLNVYDKQDNSNFTGSDIGKVTAGYIRTLIAMGVYSNSTEDSLPQNPPIVSTKQSGFHPIKNTGSDVWDKIVNSIQRGVSGIIKFSAYCYAFVSDFLNKLIDWIISLITSPIQLVTKPANMNVSPQSIIQNLLFYFSDSLGFNSFSTLLATIGTLILVILFMIMALSVIQNIRSGQFTTAFGLFRNFFIRIIIIACTFLMFTSVTTEISSFTKDITDAIDNTLPNKDLDSMNNYIDAKAWAISSNFALDNSIIGGSMPTNPVSAPTSKDSSGDSFYSQYVDNENVIKSINEHSKNVLGQTGLDLIDSNVSDESSNDKNESLYDKTAKIFNQSSSSSSYTFQDVINGINSIGVNNSDSQIAARWGVNQSGKSTSYRSYFQDSNLNSNNSDKNNQRFGGVGSSGIVPGKDDNGLAAYDKGDGKGSYHAYFIISNQVSSDGTQISNNNSSDSSDDRNSNNNDTMKKTIQGGATVYLDKSLKYSGKLLQWQDLTSYIYGTSSIDNLKASQVYTQNYTGSPGSTNSSLSDPTTENYNADPDVFKQIPSGVKSNDSGYNNKNDDIKQTSDNQKVMNSNALMIAMANKNGGLQQDNAYSLQLSTQSMLMFLQSQLSSDNNTLSYIGQNSRRYNIKTIIENGRFNRYISNKSNASSNYWVKLIKIATTNFATMLTVIVIIGTLLLSGTNVFSKLFEMYASLFSAATTGNIYSFAKACVFFFAFQMMKLTIKLSEMIFPKVGITLTDSIAALIGKQNDTGFISNIIYGLVSVIITILSIYLLSMPISHLIKSSKSAGSALSGLGNRVQRSVSDSVNEHGVRGSFTNAGQTAKDKSAETYAQLVKLTWLTSIKSSIGGGIWSIFTFPIKVAKGADQSIMGRIIIAPLIVADSIMDEVGQFFAKYLGLNEFGQSRRGYNTGKKIFSNVGKAMSGDEKTGRVDRDGISIYGKPKDDEDELEKEKETLKALNEDEFDNNHGDEIVNEKEKLKHLYDDLDDEDDLDATQDDINDELLYDEDEKEELLNEQDKEHQLEMEEQDLENAKSQLEQKILNDELDPTDENSLNDAIDEYESINLSANGDNSLNNDQKDKLKNHFDDDKLVDLNKQKQINSLKKIINDPNTSDSAKQMALMKLNKLRGNDSNRDDTSNNTPSEKNNTPYSMRDKNLRDTYSNNSNDNLTLDNFIYGDIYDKLSSKSKKQLEKINSAGDKVNRLKDDLKNATGMKAIGLQAKLDVAMKDLSMDIGNSPHLKDEINKYFKSQIDSGKVELKDIRSKMNQQQYSQALSFVKSNWSYDKQIDSTLMNQLDARTRINVNKILKPFDQMASANYNQQSLTSQLGSMTAGVTSVGSATSMVMNSNGKNQSNTSNSKTNQSKVNMSELLKQNEEFHKSSMKQNELFNEKRLNADEDRHNEAMRHQTQIQTKNSLENKKVIEKTKKAESKMIKESISKMLGDNVQTKNNDKKE